MCGMCGLDGGQRAHMGVLHECTHVSLDWSRLRTHMQPTPVHMQVKRHKKQQRRNESKGGSSKRSKRALDSSSSRSRMVRGPDGDRDVLGVYGFTRTRGSQSDGSEDSDQEGHLEGELQDKGPRGTHWHAGGHAQGIVRGDRRGMSTCVIGICCPSIGLHRSLCTYRVSRLVVLVSENLEGRCHLFFLPLCICVLCRRSLVSRWHRLPVQLPPFHRGFLVRRQPSRQPHCRLHQQPQRRG